VGEAVRGLLPEVVATLSGRSPVAVFGHSLGAVLAYELARAIEERTELPLVHVFVSGSPAPWRGRVQQVVTLDDDEFVARVEKLAGYRHAAFDSPEFRDLLLPTLRADVAMHEAYRPLSDEPIQAPVTCLRGETDELVAEAAARQWVGATSGTFTYRSVPGGHMYLTERPEAVVELMARALGVGVPAAMPGGDREAGARCG
jgi:surfactin synthase thioesterase subunit